MGVDAAARCARWARTPGGTPARSTSDREARELLEAVLPAEAREGSEELEMEPIVGPEELRCAGICTCGRSYEG